MKNSKYYVINMKLYMDALKQLRLIGFICLGVLSIIAVMMPVGRAINMAQNQYTTEFLKEIVTTNSYIFMYLIFIIVTPVITLYIFSFLTKRNACDYFHAFPQKRGCLYLTYLAAAVTWIFLITVVSGMLTGILQTILSKYFLFSYWDLLKYSIAVFLCSLLVAAAISLACCITGTIFTNIVVTGLILFLPRLIITIAVSIVASNLNILLPSKVLPLLDYSYNMLFNALSVAFNRQGVEIYQTGSLIYTVILIVLYIVIARVLFIKRKSETAGNASANPFLQCVIRLGIAIPVSLIPLNFLFEYIIGKNTFTNSTLFSIVALYMIAIGLMLLYELISTKKFKNVVRALPSIVMLVVINVFILLGLFGIYQNQLNYLPSEREVQYVVVTTDKGNQNLDYFESEMKNKKIKNPEFEQFLLDQLEKNIEYEKTAYPFLERRGISSVGNVDSGDQQLRYHNITVGFRTGITVKYRRLYLETKDYKKYVSLLLSSSDIKDLYLMLPEYDKNLMSFGNGLSDEQCQEIYNILREEVKGMDYATWYSQLYEQSSSIFLQWSYNVHDQRTMTVLPLSSYTSRALLQYINITNSTVEKPKLKDDLKKITEDNSEWDTYFISLQQYNKDNTDYIDRIDVEDDGNSNKTQNQKIIKKLYDALDTDAFRIDSQNTMDALSNNNKSLVRMNIRYQKQDSTEKLQYKNYSLSVYAYIDNTLWDELIK